MSEIHVDCMHVVNLHGFYVIPATCRANSSAKFKCIHLYEF